MKIGLYNITFLGIWYKGPQLSVDELVRTAVDMGFDGIEIDAKRPHWSPLDLDAKRRATIRDACRSAGLEIPAVSANNDFSSPIHEHLEAQLVWVKEQIALARDLGAPLLRVFFAWPGVTIADGVATYDISRRIWDLTDGFFPRLQRWQIVRDALREAAGYAEDAGVTLVLQNHKPLLRHYRDMLDMIQEVDSPALKACLDAPLLERQDDEYVRRAVHETGALQAHSHFGGEFERGPDGAVREYPFEHWREKINYPAFIKALKGAGYDGYLTYELCHPCLRGHDYQGIDFVREHTTLALEYMRKLLIQEGAYTGGAVTARA